MTVFRRKKILAGLTALALAVAGPGGATAEGGSTQDKADKATTGERHCTVDLTTSATACFGTFRAAIEHATAGRVTDATLDARSAMADSKTTAALNSGGSDRAPIVIGVQYYWENYNRYPDQSLHHPAYTLTHSGNFLCTGPTGDIDYRSAPLLNDAPPGGTVNWNNNIRSFQSFNSCWQRMWDNANCTGLLLDYWYYSVDLGAGRDRTECIEWS